MGVCNCSMFCCTLLYVCSSIAIILMGKRELIALLNLSSWCLVMVERLFLAVPRGCLQFVIVVFLIILTYYYILQKRACKVILNCNVDDSIEAFNSLKIMSIYDRFYLKKSQRGSFMVWEINMGVCPRLEFDNIMFINCLGYDFYIYGAFEFLCNSIANL